MHRAMAGADAEAIGRADGTLQPADDSEQPVPWVLRVKMRGASKRVCLPLASTSRSIQTAPAP